MTTFSDRLTADELLAREQATWDQEWNHRDTGGDPPEYDATYPERLAHSAFEEATLKGLAPDGAPADSHRDLVGRPRSGWRPALERRDLTATEPGAPQRDPTRVTAFQAMW